ncbi:alpha/beta-hydrolase [Schizopora paradoxa]|uniref:Alpha/beta-hydrolase n=1 Tax=Schizopora paradoxa TaxID=27342 RepID=A0A0H2RKR9_9AGAM|nr:alpha/beta-hydrolase [Schizopora paradoxa]
MLFESMQKAVINSEGIRLAYIDSGPVPGDNYTTLVCIHGYQYSALSFARLLPKAAEHNLRVIALNRRDYAGSSPFSSNELAAIDRGEPESQDEFFKKRGLEIAEFLVWVTEELGIPKARSTVSPGGKSQPKGGLCLLGWSLGTNTALAFLAHLSSYPSTVREKLQGYLRTLVLYDPPLSTLGYPLPTEGVYSPFTDPEIPKSEMPAAFARFITGYYSHPYYALGTTGSDDITAAEKKFNLSVLQTKPLPPASAERPASSDAPGGAELLATIDDAPCARSEKAFMSAAPHVLRALLSKSVVFESNEGEENSQFSNVDVRILHGTDTLWGIVWGIWELERELERWDSEWRKRRDVSFTKMDGANHFIHWDEPDRFLSFVSH